MPSPDLQESLQKIRPTLLRFAMLQLHNEAAAEDVVQETLLAALEGKGAFSRCSQLETWAVSILRNKIVDHLRRGSRQGSLPILTTRAMKTSMPCSMVPATGRKHRATGAIRRRCLSSRDFTRCLSCA